MSEVEITPIAFDSLGVRSMATLIETKDVILFIDPSAALGPRRYGLPPHPIELKALEDSLDKISTMIRDAEIVVITHYHYDHHNPNEPEILKGKKVYLKHPKDHINVSQKIRAARFLKLLKDVGKPSRIEYADGKELRIGNTIIRFSEPVPHGVNDRLGYVIMVTVIYRDEHVLFTSDVEGPPLPIQRDIIIRENPSLLILDGPMTYMLGYRYSRKALDNSLNNLREIVRNTNVETIIIDHHFMRDLKYKKYIELMITSFPRNITLSSAAEFSGCEPLLLEARRKELYEHNE